MNNNNDIDINNNDNIEQFLLTIITERMKKNNCSAYMLRNVLKSVYLNQLPKLTT